MCYTHLTQQAVLLFHNVMAHFAEIEQKTDPTGFTTDTHWVVKRVVVVDNGISTSNGPLVDNDMHEDGETWCNTWFKGGHWKQTSYSGKFRGKYAGVGYVYDSVNDVFIQPQPFASWTLDSNFKWQAPVAQPEDFVGNRFDAPDEEYRLQAVWDEENQKWKVDDYQIGLEVGVFTTRSWNPETSSWET
jgi:hypothetical protein